MNIIKQCVVVCLEKGCCRCVSCIVLLLSFVVNGEKERNLLI